MEPRQEVSKKVPEPRKEESKRRFQIVKLEERIAPRLKGCFPYGCYKPGHCGHGACK